MRTDFTMNSSRQLVTQNVLTMRFYANWDVDRTSSSISVQRILSMVFTRLVLTKTLLSAENTPITIAVRLQGNRRILRSNDLCVPPSRLETPLDISFTIQYSHFIKRKTNNLQILIQRRKRYKNRQIPGFKTLAMGRLNLDEIMQFGGSREIIIWDATCLNKGRHSMRELHAGKIFVTNCFTQSTESPEPYLGRSDSRQRHRLVAAVNEKEPVALSEEEPEEFTSPETSDSDIDYTPRGQAGATTSRRRKKFLKQRNIKQRIVALLRKFKPDDERTTMEPHSSHSIVPPTEQELQEIFEELGNISDSGPELEPDKMSIVSNPRPKIRPFFGSKSDIMPPIVDYQNEECLFLSDDITDDSESVTSNEEILQDRQNGGSKLERDVDFAPRKESQGKPTNHVRPLNHSETLNSVLFSGDLRLGKIASDPLEDLLKRLEIPSTSTNTNQIIPEHVWISSSVDLNWLPKINLQMLEPISLFDCPSESSVKLILQAVIGKIQNFCNNNSVSPPVTILGIIGGDHLLANILNAYVHLLRDKACKEDWLQYLRFALILPPASAVGRLLSQVAGFGGYSEAIWKVLQKVSLAFRDGNSYSLSEQLGEIRNYLLALTRNQESSQRCTNLQIGEAMLQLCSKSGIGPQTSRSGESKTSDADGKLQVFVPFLAELLTGSTVGGEQTTSSENQQANIASLHFIGAQQSVEESQQTTEFMPDNASLDANTANAVLNTSAKRAAYPTQHSHSSPSIPAALNALTSSSAAVELKEKDPAVVMLEEDNNPAVPSSQPLSSPQRHGGSVKTVPTTPTSLTPSDPPQPSSSARELQIEYWTTPNYPNCSLTTAQAGDDFGIASPSSSTAMTTVGKFSMKASVRTLSIAREPLNHLLSILFVKERKKDKVLQKFGRRNKQKSLESNAAGFCAQSRVVSAVTRIVCTSGTGIGKKDTAMDITIDGVLWRCVRFFQITAQWQTHVKLFPVTFPTNLPLSIVPN